ncbi:MAG: PQQ-binding-like beta-propeller repeat protein, partial [Halobacteria archaeon]|nr:PQQ-binding-like beta-propeller repeat protein [Halobacteria archaeon]
MSDRTQRTRRWFLKATSVGIAGIAGCMGGGGDGDGTNDSQPQNQTDTNQNETQPVENVTDTDQNETETQTQEAENESETDDAAQEAPAVEDRWLSFQKNSSNSGYNPATQIPPKFPERDWSFSIGSEVTGTPVVDDSVLYIGGTDGTVYAYNATIGNQRWSVSLGDEIRASPAVSQDGSTV